jgi:hypothetical protein
MKNITLTQTNLENLEAFKALLNKDENSMVNEALELYFTEEAEKLKSLEESQTNLSYDEFWDDVEI